MKKFMLIAAIAAIAALGFNTATASAYNCTPSANVPGQNGLGVTVWTRWIDCSGAVQQTQTRAGYEAGAMWGGAFIPAFNQLIPGNWATFTTNMTTVPGTRGDITTSSQVLSENQACVNGGAAQIQAIFTFRVKNPLSPFNWGPWHMFYGPLAFSTC